jgi:hypothetical protein
MNPIRNRKGNTSNYFLSTTCPLKINIACARSGAAHKEYLAIRADVEQAP